MYYMLLHDIRFVSYSSPFYDFWPSMEVNIIKSITSLKENFIIYSIFSTNIAGLKSRLPNIINVFWKELGGDILWEQRSAVIDG